MPTFPYSIISEVPPPPRPDPTYTFWKHPNDTFPLGRIVYFIYCAGRIKIGHTNDLRVRLKQITMHAPALPTAILVVKGGREVEQELHDRFAADRLHGEWFRLSEPLRGLLRRRLCPVGRASLKRVEADFKAHCQEMLP